MPDHRTVRVTITFDIEAAGGSVPGAVAVAERERGEVDRG